MSTNVNNSFTAAFSKELEKAGIKPTTSPQICCRTILRKLNVHQNVVCTSDVDIVLAY